ncbi:MAG: helix-turn-helix domain-containing protein [Thaumarchaeota archaeon]|nr:helix-turn-helix domain-containing protein [Nitrososphaerota archaeon]
MPKEEFLVDPSSPEGVAKRVLVSPNPSEFKAASGKVGQRILTLLAAGEKYPAEIARSIGAHHQTVYYHIARLEKSGLISPVRRERIRGGEATVYALSSGGYAVEFPVKGEPMPSLRSLDRSDVIGRFFKEFTKGGTFDGWVVVGSPLQHGESETQARDGHYAVQLGFALGQLVSLPAKFPVKLDVDVKAEKLEKSNLVLVGGPRTNVLSQEINPHLPVRFRQGGFWGSIVDQAGRSYSSEMDSIVAKVKNPWSPQHTCVVAAGLTGAGTKAAIIGVCNFADTLFHKYRSGDFAAVLRGVDRDGDGKVDSVEVLRRLQ